MTRYLIRRHDPGPLQTPFWAGSPGCWTNDVRLVATWETMTEAILAVMRACELLPDEYDVQPIGRKE